jgi:hypothetical protein
MVSGIKAKDSGSLVMAGSSTGFTTILNYLDQSTGGGAFVPPIEAWTTSAVREIGRQMFIVSGSQAQSGGCKTAINKASRESRQNAASH